MSGASLSRQASNRTLRSRVVAQLLLFAFLSSWAHPIVQRIVSDPLSRMLAAQTWCVTAANAGVVTRTSLSDDGSPAPIQHTAAKHCPLCAFEHQPFVAALAAEFSPHLSIMREDSSARLNDIPRVRSPWRATLSRAPPEQA